MRQLSLWVNLKPVCDWARLRCAHSRSSYTLSSLFTHDPFTSTCPAALPAFPVPSLCRTRATRVAMLHTLRLHYKRTPKPVRATTLLRLFQSGLKVWFLVLNFRAHIRVWFETLSTLSHSLSLFKLPRGEAGST
eukprot:1906258-Rhodomonas_salina.1